jgi:hypothetical protein
VHERLEDGLEVRGLLLQPRDESAGPHGRGRDRRAVRAVDEQAVRSGAVDGRPGFDQGGGEPGRVPRGDGDAAGPDELADGAGPDEPALVDDHGVVGGVRDLGQQVAGQEDRAAVVREGAQEGPHHPDAVRVEPVEGLVEHEGGRVADQGAAEREPLAHAEGVAADPAVGSGRQAHQVQHLLDAPEGSAGLQGEDAQVPAGGPVGVQALVEHGPDHAHRVGHVAVAAAVDGGGSAGRDREPEQGPHARRLPGPVRPEERGDAARLHVDREVVDRRHGAVPLRQRGEGDGHGGSLRQRRGGRSERGQPVAGGPGERECQPHACRGWTTPPPAGPLPCPAACGLLTLQR